MDAKELSTLNLSHDLHKGKNAYIMLRLLIENSKLGTILFIDDFEKIISIAKPQDETLKEVFDPSWLYGSEMNPNDIASEKIFTKIIQLQQIEGLRIIITLKSIQSLEQIRNKYQDFDSELLSLIKEPLYLKNFSGDDIFEFYRNTMSTFYDSIECNEFSQAFEDPYFPLNKLTLNNIFEHTQGNPRAIIKILIKIFNEIIDDEENLDLILKKYEKLDNYHN